MSRGSRWRSRSRRSVGSAPHTHIKDERGVDPDFAFLIPGEGEMDYARYLTLMDGAGYDGPIVVEISLMVQARPDYDPLAAAAQSYRVVSEAFEKAGLRAVVSDRIESPDDEIHTSPAYRRALWIVVALNVGYGLVEIVAGFLADSQALKADALDFLGDGLITGLGIVAIGWGLLWRARAALIQGVFLGGLGFWVLVTTLLRISGGHAPEAELMGVFGLVALVVNLLSAWVLVPFREGDANVRAIWLFTRNDAIGNIAVVVAAVVVALTGRGWPDLLVAFAISALFLQSSVGIIRAARHELEQEQERGQSSSSMIRHFGNLH